MKTPLAPWLVFFRLPNLPTAPGDAIAGAGIALAVSQSAAGALEPGTLLRVFTAGAAALFFYLFGLADNDIVGAETDKIQAPGRPIPAGAISLAQARAARLACLALAIGTGLGDRLPLAWWIAAAALVAVILAYNRFKERCRIFGLIAMGLCRGASLLTGVAALDSVVPGALRSSAALLAVLGWTAYISAVTWLAAKEHEARAPLSRLRFLPGLAVFIPMLALGLYPRDAWLLIVLCSVCAYGVWALSVSPLGREHDPNVRRRAVANAIGAIIYLQAAYILAFPHVALIAVVIAIFLSSSMIRKFFANVSGS